MLIRRRVVGTIAYMGGVPALLSEFTWAWSQMLLFNRDYLCGPTEDVFYDRATVSDHAFARNMLAARAKGDWLLMIDTDHSFEPDLAVRLVRELTDYDLDVVSGRYHYKGAPHPPLWFLRQEDGTLGHLGAWDDPGGRYLVPIASAGAGVLLIRRRVFARIAAELNEQPFGHRGSMSEDHSFFDRCHQLGIEAYGAPHIESLHLTSRGVGAADYAPDPALLGPRRTVGA